MRDVSQMKDKDMGKRVKVYLSTASFLGII